MYVLAKLFLWLLRCLLERKISLLSGSLGCKLLFVLTKEHMFLFDQKTLVIETVICRKRNAGPEFPSSWKRNWMKESRVGLALRTELDLNLSSISSRCWDLRLVVDLEVDNSSLLISIDVGLLASCVIVLWPQSQTVPLPVKGGVFHEECGHFHNHPRKNLIPGLK